MTFDKVKHVAWMGIKLAVTGATIAALAFAFGVFDPDLQVQESEADIFVLDIADPTPRTKFVEALDVLGHSKPRPFDLNGNTVFFSSKQTEDPPLMVMEDYQRTFRDQGLNKDVYLDINEENQDDIMLAGMTGGMVPMMVTDEYIMLGGMETASEVRSTDDLMKLDKTHDKTKPYEIFKSYKSVEIFKTPHNTLVSASWSDESFNYDKMFIDSESEDRNVNREVPACPGCVRVTAFEDLSENTYRKDVYVGKRSPTDMARFYDQSMRNRGWEPTEATRAFDTIKQYADFQGDDAILRQYARGHEFLTIMTHPDSIQDHSVVHAVKTN